MDWVRAHPYVAGALAAGSLLVFGAAIVSNRTAVSPKTTDGAWSAVGGRVLQKTPSDTQGDSTNRSQTLLGSSREAQGPYDYLPAIPVTPAETTGESGDAADLRSILAQLIAPATSAQGGEGSGGARSGLESVYAFIPQGLVGTTSLSSKRTADETRLYDYGNRLGSIIRSFEETHAHIPQILKDTLEDPNDTEKLARADRIGSDFIALGKELAALPNVPSSVSALHEALALSYREIGAKLTLPMHAQGDAAKLQAFEDYNASAERFAKAFVALATYFDVAHVRFTEQDPGSIFVFTANASL